MQTEWRIDASYEGYDQEFDHELEKLVGRESCGTGFGFMNGCRDISWEFKQQPAAERAAKKLKRRKRIKSVELSQLELESYDTIQSFTIK